MREEALEINHAMEVLMRAYYRSIKGRRTTVELAEATRFSLGEFFLCPSHVILTDRYMLSFKWDGERVEGAHGVGLVRVGLRSGVDIGWLWLAQGFRGRNTQHHESSVKGLDGKINS